MTRLVRVNRRKTRTYVESWIVRYCETCFSRRSYLETSFPTKSLRHHVKKNMNFLDKEKRII